jgi:hypothetical protein
MLVRLYISADAIPVYSICIAVRILLTGILSTFTNPFHRNVAVWLTRQNGNMSTKQAG